RGLAGRGGKVVPDLLFVRGLRRVELIRSRARRTAELKPGRTERETRCSLVHAHRTPPLRSAGRARSWISLLTGFSGPWAVGRLRGAARLCRVGRSRTGRRGVLRRPLSE